MADVIVKLSRQYTVHDQVFDSVTMREPTFKDIYMDGLGEPQEYQPTPGGGYMVVTNYQAIAAYVQRLATSPTAECLTQINAADSAKLSRAVTGFFRVADEPKKTPDGSSSDAGSPPTPSNA